MSSKTKFIDASKDRIALVEERLAGILRPIKPRQEFVKGVRRRIEVLRQPSVVGHLTLIQFILVVLAGVFSAAVLMVTGTRALLSLLARLGVIEATGREKRARVQAEY